VDHPGLRVAKDPRENTPRGEAREAIEITEPLMCFHGHTLAQFLTRVKPPFSVFYGL
jgi:hypothetical protein